MEASSFQRMVTCMTPARLFPPFTTQGTLEKTRKITSVCFILSRVVEVCLPAVEILCNMLTICVAKGRAVVNGKEIVFEDSMTFLSTFRQNFQAHKWCRRWHLPKFHDFEKNSCVNCNYLICPTNWDRHGISHSSLILNGKLVTLSLSPLSFVPVLSRTNTKHRPSASLSNSNSNSHSHSHSHSHSRSHSHPLALTVTPTLFLSHTRTLTHHTHALSLSHAHVHTHSLIQSFSLLRWWYM